MKKYLVSDRSAGYGGRVTKYKHRFCNTEFGSLKFSKQEVGIICVMLLRGPQTPGELRARTNRLCEFADSDQVESTLKNLMEREDGPFIARLPRAPGARESRYAHLFSGIIDRSRSQPAARKRCPARRLWVNGSASSKKRCGSCVRRWTRSLRRVRRRLGFLLGISSGRRCRLLGDSAALLEPFAERVDVRGAHAVCGRAMALEPLLHRGHQLDPRAGAHD